MTLIIEDLPQLFTTALSKMLVKAVSDNPDEWEKLWDWDPRYGGGYPTGKQSGTKETGGGGAMEIHDFIQSNPRIIGDALGRGKDRKLVQYPLEGREVVPWRETARELNLPYRGKKSTPAAIKTHGGFAKPSAMPGNSILDVPAMACPYSTRGDPNTACGNCYACDHKERFNDTQNARWRMLDMLLDSPLDVQSALQETIYPSALGVTPRGEKPVVRSKTAGDIQGPGELSMVSDLMASLNDNEKMDLWMNTRQYPFVEQFLDARGWEDDAIPENMGLRVSLPGTMTIDDIVPGTEYLGTDLYDLMQHPRIKSAAYNVHSPNAVTCPKTVFGGGCDTHPDPITGESVCRVCFRNKDHVSYLDHDNPDAVAHGLAMMQPTRLTENELQGLYDNFKDF